MMSTASKNKPRILKWGNKSKTSTPKEDKDAEKDKIIWKSRNRPTTEANGVLDRSPERDKGKQLWGRGNRMSSLNSTPDSSPERKHFKVDLAAAKKQLDFSNRRYAKMGEDDKNEIGSNRKDSFTDEKHSDTADSGVGRESPIHPMDEKLDEWVRANSSNSEDIMDVSIRSLINNYANRTHIYPTAGTLPEPEEIEYLQAQLGKEGYVSERVNEKKTLGGLNNRFSNYIEHVRNLEAENISLMAELKTYQQKYKTISLHLKMKYQTEIDECRVLSDESKKKVEQLQGKQDTLKQEAQQWREKYKDLLEKDSDGSTEVRRLELLIQQRDGEISAMQAMVDGMEKDIFDLSETLSQLQQQESALEDRKVDKELQWDIKGKIAEMQEKKQQLEDQHLADVARLKKNIANRRRSKLGQLSQEEMVQILQELLRNSPGLMPGNKLNSMISDVVEAHSVGEDLVGVNRQMKLRNEEVNVLKEINKKLKDRIEDLERWLKSRRTPDHFDMDEHKGHTEDHRVAIRKTETEKHDLRVVIDRLQREADWYRNKMKKFEEDEWMKKTQQHITITENVVANTYMVDRNDSFKLGIIKKIVGSVPRPLAKRRETALKLEWEDFAPKFKTQIVRTNQGPVSIREVDVNGKYLILENASFKLRKDEFMGEWKVERYLSRNRRVVFTMPGDYILRCGEKCQIWAKEAGGHHQPPEQLECVQAVTWGVGINILTRLLDENGQEKATHVEIKK